MHAVGISNPVTSAVAPDGVLEIEMFSVVPRVTDAQPTHGTANAAAKNSLIIGYSPKPTSTSRNLELNASGRHSTPAIFGHERRFYPAEPGEWRDIRSLRHFLSSSMA
jgi:hypothetical protein